MIFVFRKNHNYHQIGNTYLEFDLTVRKNDSTNFHHDDAIRLVKTAFDFCSEEARLSTSIGNHFEDNKIFGQVSTIMKVISNKYGDLLSQFDNINEDDIPIFRRLMNSPAQIRNTPQQKLLINNHTDANKGKIERHLKLEGISGFCKKF